MKKYLPSLLLLSVMAMSGNVMAACDIPDEPRIPDGAAATGADMINAKKAITEYLAAAEQYLSWCAPVDMQESMSVRLDELVSKFNNELIAYSKVPNAAVRFSANALVRR